jgi:hypothetical protein
LLAHARNERKPPSQLKPGLAQITALDEIVLFCIAAKRERRFEDMNELADALRKCIDNAEGGVSSSALPAPPRSRRLATEDIAAKPGLLARLPLGARLGAAAAAALAVVAVLTLRSSDGNETSDASNAAREGLESASASSETTPALPTGTPEPANAQTDEAGELPTLSDEEIAANEELLRHEGELDADDRVAGEEADDESGPAQADPPPRDAPQSRRHTQVAPTHRKKKAPARSRRSSRKRARKPPRRRAKSRTAAGKGIGEW